MNRPNQVVTLNGAKLKQIAHASHTATVTMTSLALRERLRHSSDIVRTKNQLIREGEKIVDSDYMSMWEALQSEGVGSIVYGRKHKPDRFEWYYSLKQVAKAGLEGTNEEVEKINGFKKKAPLTLVKKQVRPKLSDSEMLQRAKSMTSLKSKPAPEVRSNNVIHSKKLVFIPLRKDFNLEISLPMDLTTEELNIIQSALSRISA